MGVFEVTFLDQMKKRYQRRERTVTVLEQGNKRSCKSASLSCMGQLYFPAHSNGLKDVAGFIGLPGWPDPEGNRTNSIVWVDDGKKSESPELQRSSSHITPLIVQRANCFPQIFSHSLSRETRKTGTEAERFTFVVDHLTNPFSHPDWQNICWGVPELDPDNQAANGLSARQDLPSQEEANQTRTETHRSKKIRFARPQGSGVSSE